ncbi:hypothetical protein LJR118_000296 [Acidovorax sp. LjRoot118]|uniref:hypothetical protein n=1 Tax=Acidovorax sp. LjRoot118 TaxID=3342256 RepID=UPI003ED0B68A
MTITLTKGSDVLELPEDLLWSDEFSWSDVAQSADRGIEGHLILEAMVRSGGRPITLSGDGNSAWIQRSTLIALKAWAKVPLQLFELDLRGEVFTVVFDHGGEEETRAMAMSPVVDYSDMEDGDFYCSLMLRFLEANPI